MKKIIKKIIASVSCFAMLAVSGISLTACGKKEDPAPAPAPAPAPSTPLSTATITPSFDKLTTEMNVISQKFNSIYVETRNTSGERINHSIDGTDSFFTGKFTKEDYYLEAATLSGFGEITKVTIGNQEFGDEDIYISVGENHFIQSKAWYIQDNKLYIAYPIFLYELQQNLELTINGVKQSLIPTTTDLTSQMPEVKQAKFADAKAYDAETSKSEVVKGADANDVLNVSIKLADGKQAISFDFGELTNELSKDDVVYTKHVKDGKVGYGLTKLDGVVNGRVALNFYPVAWKDDATANDYASEIGKTIYYTAMHMGGGVITYYNANIKIESKATYVSEFSELQNAIEAGGEIVLENNIKLTQTLVVKKDTVLDLNGHNLTENFSWSDVDEHDDDVWAMFKILGATLKVKGSGEVTSDDLYIFSVEGKFADTKNHGSYFNEDVTTASKVIIENGKYESDTTIVYLIGEKTTCEIKGGEYSITTSGSEKFLLNFRGEWENNNPGIVVTGGTFTNFDPSKAPGESAGFLSTHRNGYVADGYVSTEGDDNNGIFTVTKEAE